MHITDQVYLNNKIMNRYFTVQKTFNGNLMKQEMILGKEQAETSSCKNFIHVVTYKNLHNVR